jgi:hypothetical protein
MMECARPGSASEFSGPAATFVVPAGAGSGTCTLASQWVTADPRTSTRRHLAAYTDIGVPLTSGLTDVRKVLRPPWQATWVAVTVLEPVSLAGTSPPIPRPHAMTPAPVAGSQGEQLPRGLDAPFDARLFPIE